MTNPPVLGLHSSQPEKPPTIIPIIPPYGIEPLRQQLQRLPRLLRLLLLRHAIRIKIQRMAAPAPLPLPLHIAHKLLRKRLTLHQRPPLP